MWPTTTTVLFAASVLAARSTWSMRRMATARCNTFGDADFMRVPLPAARMTRCMSGINEPAGSPARLRARAQLDGRPGGRVGSFHDRLERPLLADRFELGVLARE